MQQRPRQSAESALETRQRSVIFGYGTALASVAIAMAGLVAMQAHWHESAPVSMFLVALEP